MEKTDKKRSIEDSHMDSAESSDSEMESGDGGSDDEQAQQVVYSAHIMYGMAMA